MTTGTEDGVAVILIRAGLQEFPGQFCDEVRRKPSSDIRDTVVTI